jgi:hypothetical protein
MKGRQSSTPTPAKSDGVEEGLSQTLSTPLRKLVSYDQSTYANLAISLLKNPLELEARKLQDERDPQGQKLLLLVLNNHLKAIIELKGLPPPALEASGGQTTRRSFN